MIDLIYNHPFYLVGTLVAIAMFFMWRSMRHDIQHNNHHHHRGDKSVY